LYHSVSHGYFDARTLQFITGGFLRAARLGLKRPQDHLLDNVRRTVLGVVAHLAAPRYNWNSAFSKALSGSSPEPEAITKSLGTSKTSVRHAYLRGQSGKKSRKHAKDGAQFRFRLAP